MERTDKAMNRRAGRVRFRWVLVAVIASVLLLVVVLAALDSVVSRKTRKVQDRISEEQQLNALAADSGADDFQRFLDQGARGEYTIDGPALQRFIQRRYGSGIPDSVGPWRIMLHEGLAAVEGVVDLERYLGQMGMERPASLESVAGRIPFGFRGRLKTDNGQGIFVIEEVTLLGLTLPLDLVERIGGGGSGGSVLIQRFTLPGGISGARIVRDKVVINGGRLQ